MIFGASHTVVLARKQTDDYALCHGAGVDHGNVKLKVGAVDAYYDSVVVRRNMIAILYGSRRKITDVVV